MQGVTWKDRLQYAFDNTLARGPIALVGWLAMVSAIFVGAMTGLALLLNANPDFGLGETAWTMLLQALAPNPVELSAGPPLFLGLMFVITLGGIFLVSLFIGVLTTDLDSRVQDLRKGRSRVIETGHTVVLGWSQQVTSVVSELVQANASRRDACIVILADRDKVEMEDDLRQTVGGTGTTRVVCRSGSPIDMDSLALASLDTARAIIVLAPDIEEPDAHVIKAVLAITNGPRRRPEPYHIVAELRDPGNLVVARLAGGDEAEFVLVGDLIARIIAQTCRQSGLSSVYTELLNFAGDEIYFHSEPALTGKTFGESLAAYGTSTVIGIVPTGGTPRLNPPAGAVIGPGDQLIVIARDDDAIALDGRPASAPHSAPAAPRPPHPAAPERTLLLGWNWRAPVVINQIDCYVAAGSALTVVARKAPSAAEIAECCGQQRNQTVTFREADTTSRPVLDSLDVPSYQHVVLLCYSNTMGREEADAQTLMTLLHLRDIADRTGHRFSIVSEMLEVRNRRLAEVTRADDFIVSDNVVSLIMAQIAENKGLSGVFGDLFDPEGSEIYLRPAGDYVELGRPVDMYTVADAALARGEVAIGYRLHAHANDSSQGHGVVVNPRKSDVVTFAASDRIIVLAEGEAGA